jgi:hypothetical protein
MPPEQRKDAALVDARSDLWALGATLYQMVSGRSPKIIKFSQVPQALQDVLEKALEDEKDDRYQTAREFRDALRAAQQGGGGFELEEGSCPNCGTKNTANRKFCRNGSCGASLLVSCLSCAAEMPMWEKVCGGCGAKQSEPLNKRRKQMASDLDEATSLLKINDFDGATNIVVALRDEPDLRLQHLKDWADNFLLNVEQRRQQELVNVGRQLQEIAAHEQAQDFVAGLRVLEQIPENLREGTVPGQTETVKEMLSRFRAEVEADQLLAEIKRQMGTRSYKGVLKRTTRFLEIRPDREDVRRLQNKLQRQQEKRTAQQATLKKVRSAEILDEVRERMREKDCASVVLLLEDMPPQFVTDETKSMLHKAKIRVQQSKQLLEELNEQIKSGQTSTLLPRIDKYLKLVAGDERIEALREKLIGKKDATLRRVKIAAAATAAVLFVVGCFWIPATLRLHGLAEAVRQRNWDEALTIAPEFFPALVERARDHLTQEQPDLNEALADLQTAESIGVTGNDIAVFELVIADLEQEIVTEANAEEDARSEADEMNPRLEELRRYRRQATDSYDRSVQSARFRDVEVVYEGLLEKADSHREQITSLEQQRDAIKGQIEVLNSPAGHTQIVDELRALAYAKQAASLASDGKITDAEKDLKEAETLDAGRDRSSSGRFGRE